MLCIDFQGMAHDTINRKIQTAREHTMISSQFLQYGHVLGRLILLPLLMLTVNSNVHAIDPVRAGFVDIGRIMQATGMAKASEAMGRQVVMEARSELEAEQQAIVKMQEDYKRDEAIMSESQRSSQQRAIESRMQAYQQKALDLQQEINKKKLQHAEKALQPVQKIVTDIATEEGLNAVFELSDSAVLFVDNSLDLTDRVIERLKAGGN
jgi:outer membrane protein